MRYYVTFDASVPAGVEPPADKSPSQPFELADALTHACRLLDENARSVAIRDDAGHSIAGQDLKDCCSGDKIIAADLHAVSG